MKIGRYFTGFAAAYFFLVFLKDGTVVSVAKDMESGANKLLKSSQRLTKLT